MFYMSRCEATRARPVLDIPGFCIKETLHILGELLLMHHGIFLEAHVHEDLNGSLDILNQRGGLCLPQFFPLLGEQVLIFSYLSLGRY